MCCVYLFLIRSLISVFFFFKQKTAYEMRISDWSSDVCSSDVRQAMHFELGHEVRPMNFHRSSRYVEIIGDGLVGKAVGEADENLSFARREHGDPHPRLRLSKRPRVGLIVPRESHADRKSTRLNSSH